MEQSFATVNKHVLNPEVNCCGYGNFETVSTNWRMKSEVWLTFTCAQVQQESSCTPITDFALPLDLTLYNSEYTAIILHCCFSQISVSPQTEKERV